MPHKLNAARRDKIPKQKHRVTNWAEYSKGLRQRHLELYSADLMRRGESLRMIWLIYIDPLTLDAWR